MNILIIDDEWPSKSSGKFLRIENIYKRLKDKGNLHFLYIGDKPPSNIELINKIFNSIDSIRIENNKGTLWGRLINLFLMQPGDYYRWSNTGVFKMIRDKIEKKIKDNKIDLLHVYSYFTAQYCADFKQMAKIWDVGDSVYLALKRVSESKKSSPDLKTGAYLRKVLNYEQKMIKKYDKTIFVSSVDAKLHNDLNDKISIIPNGVDIEYFKAIDSVEDYPSLIFTGHMNFGPNVEAVLYFAEKILLKIRKEFSNLKFYVVGADPIMEVMDLNGKDGIIVTGFVDDIRPYVAKSTVFVAPMLSGSGIKNKLLQAMAMNKPIVSTALGIEAISCKPNIHLKVSDTADQFARAVIELLKDKNLQRTLGSNCRSLVENEYTWQVAVSRYVKLCAFASEGKYE